LSYHQHLVINTNAFKRERTDILIVFDPKYIY